MDNVKNKGEISFASVFVAVQDQVSTNLEDEAVILHLKKGVYYGLNPVGARVWSFLQEPHSVVEIRDMILQEYEVAPQRCEQDLLELLKELLSNGLIDWHDVKAS